MYVSLIIICIHLVLPSMAEDLGVTKKQNRIDDPIKSLDLLRSLELALFCISVINFFLLSTILYAIAILCSNHNYISKNDHKLTATINSSNDSISGIYEDSLVQSSIENYAEQSEEILMESLEGNQRHSGSISFSFESERSPRERGTSFPKGGLRSKGPKSEESSISFSLERSSDENFLQESNTMAGETARRFAVAGETARVFNVDSSYVDSWVEDSDQASNYYSKKSVSSNSSKSTVTIAIL